MNRKKILFYCMQGVISGGSDTCLYLLIKNLDRSKYEPVLLYKYRSELVKDLQNYGITLIPLTENPSQQLIVQENTANQQSHNPAVVKFILDHLGHIGLLLSNLKHIIKKLPETFKYVFIILKNRIDIVHTNHHITSDRTMIIAGLLLRRKIVCHNRGYYPPEFIDTYLSNGIHRIICMSNFSKSVYINNGIDENKCTTIYDGIDINKFQPSYKTSNSFIVGCFGRLERWKGQHILIDAVEIIVKTHKEIKFMIVGEGMTENELKLQVKSKNLEKYVEFTGGVTNVVDYMKRCTVVVHTSIEPEPFGMVIIEAMALAKPVIATNFGGPLEIIDQGVDGFLIPPQDPHILAEYILKLINNTELAEKIANNARQKVISKFEVRKYTLQIEQVYNQIYY